VKQEDINTFTVIKFDENHHVIVDEYSEIIGYHYCIVNYSEYLKKQQWVIKGTITYVRNYHIHKEL
jgi:hypothetical protein